jgi:hypothetical protein
MRRINFLMVVAIVSGIPGFSANAQTLPFNGGQDGFISAMQNNSSQAYYALLHTSTYGTFVLMHLNAGSDSVNSFRVLSAVDPYILSAVTAGIRSTRGKWSTGKKDQDIFVPLFYCMDDQSSPAKRENIQIPNNFSDWPSLSNGLLLKPVVIWVVTPSYPKK